ncbi:MAG: helix-turn-helix domain-containing protein [Clostridiales bacterium]|nr:helix-turn-helix domain-containing protein [Clostridiales bacterium]
MIFGEKLKLLRNENHLTQEALAEKLSVSRQAVSKWESGTGYPETEKMLELSKMFNISLDYLLLDGEYLSEEKEADTRSAARSYNGKIAIMSFDKSNVVNCISVKSSKILASAKNEPSYILTGIDKITFLGEHSTILGFYENADDVQKEIAAINEAIASGEHSYKLQCATDVEYVGLFAQPKLKKEE